MCGRYMLDSNIKSLLQQYRILKREAEDYKKGEIYPSENPPIIFNNGGRTLKLAKWGFPLAGKRKLVINARGESLDTKPMFKNSFNNARCILPASLFCEWKEEGDKKKVKHEIYLKDKDIISLGGVFKFTLNDKGEKELSFVIITTESNNQMKDIHSRMPLIIGDDTLDYWLDSNTSKSIIEEIIKSNVNHKLKIERDNEDKRFEQMSLF